MVNWSQLGLPDPATTVINDIIHLHGYAIFIGLLVVVVVATGLISTATSTLSCRTIYSAHRLENAWTLIPFIILLTLAAPSLNLLYQIDEMVDPTVTVKAVGHQWYWSYELGDFNSWEFDSYMVPEAELKPGDQRLLEVDKRLVLPINTRIRIIVTGADVIHSWAVPELGVNIDAIPGRLNQVALNILTPGVFNGMCSELCGVGHAFMPIILEAIPFEEFLNWATEGMNKHELE